MGVDVVQCMGISMSRRHRKDKITYFVCEGDMRKNQHC